MAGIFSSTKNESAPKSPKGDLLSSPFRGWGAKSNYYNNEVFQADEPAITFKRF
jgi:hypothetical protein